MDSRGVRSISVGVFNGIGLFIKRVSSLGQDRARRAQIPAAWTGACSAVCAIRECLY